MGRIKRTLIYTYLREGFKVTFRKSALFCSLFYAVQKYAGENVHNFVEQTRSQLFLGQQNFLFENARGYRQLLYSILLSAFKFTWVASSLSEKFKRIF